MELTTMAWVLLAVGFVPWRVVWETQKRRQGRRWQQGRSFTVQAIFWQVTVEQRPQRCCWQLTLSLIERSKAAVWAVLQDLIKGSLATSVPGTAHRSVRCFDPDGPSPARAVYLFTLAPLITNPPCQTVDASCTPASR